MWDADSYLAFADHRARPFHDLLARVGATEPRRVIDLGCGPLVPFPSGLRGGTDGGMTPPRC